LPALIEDVMAELLECGGKRSATPLLMSDEFQFVAVAELRPKLSRQTNVRRTLSAVAASLCPRTPKQKKAPGNNPPEAQ
jgi:hypothetical protein